MVWNYADDFKPLLSICHALKFTISYSYEMTVCDKTHNLKLCTSLSWLAMPMHLFCHCLNDQCAEKRFFSILKLKSLICAT